MNTTIDFSKISDPVGEWNFDILVCGKVVLENSAIRVMKTTIEVDLIVMESTQLISESALSLTLRLYQKIEKDNSKWTDIVYTLTGMKTLLTELTADNHHGLMRVTQVFTYSGVRIYNSK